MTEELLCYNKGCGNRYDPNQNGSDSCIYHPGVPVFHDALKGWSCCKRRTTDFSDFLNIPGCTKGCHSNVKPAQQLVPKVTSSKAKVAKEIETPVPKPVHKPIEPVQRPSPDKPTVPLPIKSTPSIQKALQKLSMQNQNTEKSLNQGKVCKHLSCKVEYSEGINELCVYHPGVPVFHEGMKYWSCCSRKTSDFTAFLAQEGCVKGTHEWKLKSMAEAAPCRYDWHQTGSVVVISIFAKTAMADNSSVKVNEVKMEIDVEYEGGKRSFQLNIELGGVIDPCRSFVTLFGTKVEITLKKADAFHWPELKFLKAEEKNIDKSIEDSPDENSKKEDVMNRSKIENTDKKDISGEKEDSDLSGIDDVEFD